MRHLVFVLCALLLAGCKEDASRPYVEFAGGGFVFNYRNGDAYYGFVAKPVRPMPEGAVLEARFEVPGSAEPFVQREPAKPGRLQYMFKTGDLDGIVKDHEYQVTLLVLDGEGGKELARYGRSFKTEIDQRTQFPKHGLVVGPGYQPNPEISPSETP